MSKKIVKVKRHTNHGKAWSVVVAFVTFLPIGLTSLLPFALAMCLACLLNLLVLMLSGYVLLEVGDFK